MSRIWMSRYLSGILLAGSCTWGMLSTPSRAEEPILEAMWGTSPLHYEVLRRPANKLGDPKPRTNAPQVVRPVQPYAYGWFGATPNKHWYRQFGHQSSYTQYSLR